MKKSNKYICLLLLIGAFQIDAKEENLAVEERSKMSHTELDAAFISAVTKYRAEEVEELIQAGANIHILIPHTETFGDCDWNTESTALIYAVKHNSPKVVKALLTVEKNLNEALEVAIKKGYAEVVEELIKGGAEINYVNEDGDTPLIIATQHARATAEFSPQAYEAARSRWFQRRKIIQTLLNSGANVNHANKYGRTALMEAVIKNDLNTVQKLLQIPEIHGGLCSCFSTAPINYADKDGNTALLLAIKEARFFYTNTQEYNICLNSQNIVSTLWETPGIDLDHANKKGETAPTLLEKARQGKKRVQSKYCKYALGDTE